MTQASTTSSFSKTFRLVFSPLRGSAFVRVRREIYTVISMWETCRVGVFRKSNRHPGNWGLSIHPSTYSPTQPPLPNHLPNNASTHPRTYQSTYLSTHTSIHRSFVRSFITAQQAMQQSMFLTQEKSRLAWLRLFAIKPQFLALATIIRCNTWLHNDTFCTSSFANERSLLFSIL